MKKIKQQEVEALMSGLHLLSKSIADLELIKEFKNTKPLKFNLTGDTVYNVAELYHPHVDKIIRYYVECVKKARSGFLLYALKNKNEIVIRPINLNSELLSKNQIKKVKKNVKGVGLITILHQDENQNRLITMNSHFFNSNKGCTDLNERVC